MVTTGMSVSPIMMMTAVVLFIMPAGMPVVMMLFMVTGIPTSFTPVIGHCCRTEKQQNSE
jgi:hypothetical protein